MAQAVRAAIHWTVSLCLPVYMGWYWLGLVRYVNSALGGVLATLVRAEERALQARPHHLLSRTAPGRGLLGKATWPAAPGQEPCVAA